MHQREMPKVISISQKETVIFVSRMECIFSPFSTNTKQLQT